MKTRKISLLVVLLCLFVQSLLGQSNYKKAVDAYRNDSVALAMQYLNQELHSNPHNSDALYMRGLLNMGINNLNALKDFDMALKYCTVMHDFSKSQILISKGDLYDIYLNEQDKALTNYNSAIKADKKNITAYDARAKYYYRHENYSCARLDYKKMIDLDEYNLDGMCGISACLIFQDSLKEARILLNKVIQYQNNYYPGYFNRAIINDKENRKDEAVDDILMYLNYANNPSYEFVYVIADKDFNYALAQVSKYVQSCEKNRKSYWLSIRAKIYQNHGFYEEAVTDFNAVEKEVGFGYPFLWINRGDCYKKLYQYSKAVKDYTNMVNADSLYSYTVLRRGDCYQEMGKYSEAINDFNVVISTNPEDAYYAYYRRGWIKEFQKDYDNAFADYNKGIQLKPDYAYLYLMRGECYLTYKKDTLKANEDFNKILAIDTIVKSNSCRQYALFFLGQTDSAITWMNKMIELNPLDEGNYYDAACLYARMGNSTKALDNLEKALEKGFRRFYHIEIDDDLDSIRNLPRFNEILAKYKKADLTKKLSGFMN